MITEKTALGILAFVSIVAAVGLFSFQESSMTADAAAYSFITSGYADTGEPPNKNFDIRGEVPRMCRDSFDCIDGYECKTTRVVTQYFEGKQVEYQKICVPLQ